MLRSAGLAARDREEALKILTERPRGWITERIEPRAIGVAAQLLTACVLARALWKCLRRHPPF